MRNTPRSQTSATSESHDEPAGERTPVGARRLREREPLVRFLRRGLRDIVLEPPADPHRDTDL